MSRRLVVETESASANFKRLRLRPVVYGDGAEGIMQKYRGGTGAFLSLLLMFLMLCVGPLWLGGMLLLRHDLAAGQTPIVLFGLMGLGFGWYFGWGLLEWFTVYRVDEDGITRRAWNGTRRMRWNDIARFDVNGHKDGTLALRDDQNTKVCVCYSLLNARSNRELRESIAPHLTPLHERRMRDFGSLPEVYHPHRGQFLVTGAATLLLAALILGGDYMLAAGSQPDLIGEVVVAVISLLFALAGAWLLLLGISRTLTLNNDGVTESSRFGSKTLLFHHVTSLVTRQVAYKGDRWETLRIQEGDSRKILLHSKMKDYPLLAEFIRARVAPSALEQGVMQAEHALSRERKQERVIIPVCAALIGVACTGIGFWKIVRAVPALIRQSRIDMGFQTTTGQVTRFILSHDKNEPDQIAFAFMDAQGCRLGGISPVQQSEFSGDGPGAPVAVEYVPGQPDLCRLTRNISRRNAVGNLIIAALLLVYGMGFAPFSVYLVFRKKRGQETNADPKSRV